MSISLSTRAGIRLLADIRRVFEKGRIYLRGDKVVFFVCGGPVDVVRDGEGSHRKNFLKWAARELPDFVCILAEDALSLNFVGESREFVNLSQFENVIASVSDGVVIFPESPGSHAEIGFFSNSPRVSKKTLVANLDSYHTHESFLNLGPIDSIYRKTFLKPVHLKQSDGAIDFEPLGDRLRDQFPRIGERERLPYKKFGNLTFKERLCVTFEIIRLLQPVDLSTLRHVIAECFAAHPNKKEIKHLLRILTAAGYAERIKEEDYFRAIPGVILAEIEHIEYETVLARVKQHYSKYFPEAFSTMS